MARLDLFRRLVLLDVVVVVALDVGRRHRDLQPRLIAIEQEVLDLPLLADAVFRLVRLEVRRDVRVGDGDAAAELRRGQRDDLQLHFLVALVVLTLHVGIGHRHPVGQRRAQLVEHHAAPQALFELRLRHRRVLAEQQLLVALLADEASVFLERRDREDLLGQFVVADRDAVLLGLDEADLLVDHLRQDLLVDAELPQQLIVEAAAELLAVRLHLREVALLKIASGDGAAVDLGDHFARSGAGAGRSGLDEIGNVEEHERQHHDGQAPLEPVLVPPHPVEHGHRNIRSRMVMDEKPSKRSSYARK